MKNKLFTIIILFLIFLIFTFFSFFKKNQKEYPHKILKVVEADRFFVDINDNGLIDNGEFFRVRSISAFTPVKNYHTMLEAQKLKLSEYDYLKTGFLARTWAVDNLSNKNVYVENIKCSENWDFCLADIIFENKNLASYLLKSGLSYLHNNVEYPEYFQYQNLRQAKSNAKELSQLEFFLLNAKSNILHKLTCEYGKLSHNAELILKNIEGFPHCKICLQKSKSVQHSYDIPKSKNIYKKSVYKKFDNIELFLINPLEFKKPESSCNTKICKRIVEEINSSKTSIDLALYGIGEQDAIINALRTAQKRGVKIRSVVDYSKKMDEIYPNTRAFIAQFGSKTDKSEIIMHNKFFIFDNKKVMTGSVNISPSGTGGYSANIAVIIDDALIASAYKTEFEKMHAGNFSKSKKQSPLITSNSAKTTISAYFSPQDDIYHNALLPLIKNAKREIFISVFYLTDKNLINELISAKARGIRVMVIADALGANNFKDRINLLRAKSIPVIVENWGGKNHEKTVEVDGEFLLLGSCNFSKSGFYKNDENVVLIKNTQIAALYRDYYLYLFNSIDKKFLKLFPRAEGVDSINSCYDGIDNNFDGKIDLEDEGCKALLKQK